MASGKHGFWKRSLDVLADAAAVRIRRETHHGFVRGCAQGADGLWRRRGQKDGRADGRSIGIAHALPRKALLRKGRYRLVLRRETGSCPFSLSLSRTDWTARGWVLWWGKNGRARRATAANGASVSGAMSWADRAAGRCLFARNERQRVAVTGYEGWNARWFGRLSAMRRRLMRSLCLIRSIALDLPLLPRDAA